MRDSDQQYPLHQPNRDGRHHPFDDDAGPAQASPDLDEEEAPRRRGTTVHQRESASTPQLPRGRFLNAVIIGAIIGVLACVQNIVITLINAPTFQQYATVTANVTKSALAFKIAGVGVLIFFVTLVLYFIGGLIIGRIAVHRRLGFLGGFLAAIIYYAIAVFSVRYIPSFPGNLASTGSNPVGTTMGIIVTLIVLILTGVIGGGMSLLGAWLMTRRHPYYVGYSG